MTLIGETVEQKQPRSRRPIVAAAVVVVVLVVAVVVVALRHGDDEPADPVTSTNVLPTGEASIRLDTATGSVAGFPRGFPRTEAGAVEAYLGWVLAPSEGIQQPNDVLETYYRDVMPPADAAAEAAQVFEGRAAVSLDERGEFIGEPGTDPYTRCFPEFGAYRSSPVSASEVMVDVWLPCVIGVGSPEDRSGLITYWGQSSALMTWSVGDWRTSAADIPKGEEAPVPQDKDKVNVSFTERAQILGADWEMFQGASQTWPTDVLGEEPQ